MRRRTRIALVAGTAVVALVVPSVASAHVGNVEYKFPLPVWLYALAGGLAVLASAPAAALALRSSADWTSRDLYRPLARLRLGAIGTALASVLLLDAIVGGLFGDQVSFTANPGPLLIWVDFWVGLGVVSALVGNVWDFVSPLSAAGRAIERRLAARGAQTFRYPERLGVWPSLLLLLVWSWMELVWHDGSRGRSLIVVALLYMSLQLVAMIVFGAEVWLARGELFTVVARTFSRFAPVELYVRSETEPCSAGRCLAEGERIGCPSCWLHAPRDRRGLRLRTYGAGVRREPPLGAGGGAFAVGLLATVVYDGLRSTSSYDSLQSALFPNAAADSQLAGTAMMLVVVGAFALAFVAVCAVVALFEEGGVGEAARRYAPTLVPIAAVYFIAHYYLYWIYLGQLTPGTAVDPFEREWVPDYRPWTGVPGAVVWYIQAGVIVWGHIVAVREAHRVSLGVHRRPRPALVAQLPLVLLMVGYTFTGLWVLGQTLAPEG